jgi:putative Holliday junction resolvase
MEERILGVDFGEKRIGLAVSDPTRTIATPLETVKRRTGKRPPLEKIARTARELGVRRIVVGLPLELSGEENDWCAAVRAMGEKLAGKLGVPVSFVDERMTSVRAERAMRAVGLSRSARRDKGRVDAGAAQLILQSWLDGSEARR